MNYQQLCQTNTNQYAAQPHPLFAPWYYPLGRSLDFDVIHAECVRQLHVVMTPPDWSQLYTLRRSVVGSSFDSATIPTALNIDWAGIAAAVITAVIGIVVPVLLPFEGAIEPIIEAILGYIISTIQTLVSSGVFGASTNELASQVHQWFTELPAAA